MFGCFEIVMDPVSQAIGLYKRKAHVRFYLVSLLSLLRWTLYFFAPSFLLSFF